MRISDWSSDVCSSHLSSTVRFSMAEISVMLNAGALSPATSSAHSLPDGSYWEDVDMNILLLGSGGREHALALKLAQSQQLTRLYADGKSVVSGKSVSVSVDFGGRRIIK